MTQLVNTLKAVPFEDLIANPLTAIIQGESQAARATADFIREVGFDPPDKESFDPDFGAIRMVHFKMQRTGINGEKETVKIQVPLLSLIPIPTIQVKEAVIDFSVSIHDTQTIKGEEVSSGSNKLLARRKVKLFGAVSRRKQKATKDTETITETDMNVKVTLQQADFTIGVMRLFDLLEQNITETED